MDDAIQFGPDVVELEQKECLADFAPASKVLGDDINKLCAFVRSVSDVPDDIRKLATMLPRRYGGILRHTVTNPSVDGRGEALEILKDRWKLNIRTIENDCVYMLARKLGLPLIDLAVLTGVSPASISQRVSNYESKMATDRANIKAVDPQERSDALMDRLFEFSIKSDVIDREVINAIKAFLDLQSRQVERELLTKWKIVEHLSEFFLSKFLPALQVEFRRNSINVDISTIFKGVLEEAGSEIKKIADGVRTTKTESKKKAK